MATTTFHHFPLLPLELRLQVWDLSIEPRRVLVGDFFRSKFHPKPPTPAPALLHTCVESRTHFEQYYTKAFFFTTTKPLSHYTWINFDIDTLYISQRSIYGLFADLLPVKHLSLEVYDDEFFYLNIKSKLASLPLLEDLEIRPDEHDCNYYLREWDQMMDMFYYCDKPVPFRTTVISPYPDSRVPELNPDNFLKVARDHVRRSIREYPDAWDEDFDPPDSDGDRCEPGWRHVPGCDCEPHELWAPRIA